MPTSPIIIISGGGGNRTAANTGTPYPITAGDKAENTATSGPDQYCIFTSNAMVTTDIYIPPGGKEVFAQDGALVVP